MTESVQPGFFPFTSVLSLKLLVEYWERAIASAKMPIASSLLDMLRQAPELREPVANPQNIEKYRDLINFLMTAVFAPAQSEKDLMAATVPFRFESIFETAAFSRTIDPGSLRISARVNNVPERDLIAGKTIQACMMILQQFYGVNVSFDKPILVTLRNPDNGLDKVYKLEISRQFCEIVPTGDIRPIDSRIIKFLTEKVNDVDLWLQYIRPEDFQFRGFMILHLTDVTEQEMVSSIKYDLLEKDAVSRKESFAAIEHKIRSIFSLADMRLGLAYFDADSNIIISHHHEEDCWKSLAEDQADRVECGAYQGSIYERSWMEKRYIAVEDLANYPFKTRVEDYLLSSGVKSILIAPLIEGNETIGILELTSPTVGELNPITAHKVESVLPMFISAVKRVKEESVMEVRAIIQEECTNVHPVVQWRFFEAGRRVLDKRRRGQTATFEDIVFKDVYPLYGMADIRNSSLERTAAIQEDLLENLRMARTLVEKIQGQMSLPVLDEILFKTDVQLEKVTYGLGAGDESSALDFLKREITPLISLFEDQPEYADDIREYRSHLDPVFGVVYRRRRDFESSLARINTTISNYLNEAQVAAQEMFPHYFEKYQTDGVEYTMYLGSSLIKGKQFNPLFLKNFRLWQLILSCEIENRMQVLKPSLPIPLDIAQLILVHDHALSIRFRPDEKQFDVDGAYDIRYEIIKKRIDKATAKHTGERITQPGKIAVIYNQQKVRDEYKQYFRYLASKQIIGERVEDLELNELPGATGLRALRVEIVRHDEHHDSELFSEMNAALPA